MSVLTYQSVQTNGSGNANTITVTKPTDLTVGDTMLSQFMYPSSGTSPSLPYGFSSILTTSPTNFNSIISYKIADASDVAASNFTFSYTGSNGWIGASIIRISNQSITPIGNYSGTTGNSSTLTTTTINQTIKNNLIFIFGSATSETFSGYSIATDNPTWTEIYDFNNSSASGSMACAYARRNSENATGTVSVSLSGTSTGSLQIVEINNNPITQNITETITCTDLKTSIIISSLNETVYISDSLSTSINRLWRKISKPLTTWINKSKN